MIGALQTPDGRWRVEAIKRGRNQFYRLVHGDNLVDGLAIATLERLLGEAGLDVADLDTFRVRGLCLISACS